MSNVNPMPHLGTILVVEDDRATLALLTTVLRNHGYHVQGAANGELALESIAQTIPELILLDVVMEGIDGFEICRRLKANEATKSIPVVFLSATSDSRDHVEGFTVGGVDFISKPFQRQELLARVHTHMSLARLQAELKQQKADLLQANRYLQNEVAERQAMAASLAESEEKFRSLAGSAHDAFVMVDDQDRVIFWNRAAAGMFGYAEGEITGEKFCERLVPERIRSTCPLGLAQFAAPSASTPADKALQIRALRKDRTEFPVELSVAAVKLRERWVSIAVIRDITGRLRAQETLQQSEERLNLALESAQMGTWDFDLATGKIWRSRRHDQIFGSDSPIEKWDNQKFFDYLVPEDRERAIIDQAKSLISGDIRNEYRIIRENDQCLRWIKIEGKVFRNKEGNPVRLMGIVTDITESKLAEQERRAIEAQSSLSQKLESVGRLASGVAHEINTPMQFITDNTQFIIRSVTALTEVLAAYRTAHEMVNSGKNPAESCAAVRAVEEANELEYFLGEIPRTFEETLSGLQRVTNIIKSLKEFSHPSIAAKRPADLNKAINTTVAVSRHEWKYVAEVVTELDPDLPMIPLCIDEMNQVVLNLIVNAAHAIGDAQKLRGDINSKGVITVRTKQDADNVLIEVQDNGTGIPTSAQPHIFEPFFTTKGIGKGTGQGLAIIRTIVVKNHGGTISFTTEPGKGTTFHIHLPMSVPGDAPASDPRGT